MYMNNLLSDEGSAFGRIAVSTRWSNIIILVHRLLLYDGFVSSFTKEYDPDGEKITSLVYTNEQTIQAYLVQLQQMITSQLTVSVHHIHNLLYFHPDKHKPGGSPGHSCLDCFAQ